MNPATLQVATIDKFLPRNIHSLYKIAFPKVARFVKNAGGNLEDAKDVFHDGLILFLQKIDDKKQHWRAADKDYLFGICKNIWHRKIRDKFHQEAILTHYSKEQKNARTINIDRLLNLLEMSGQKCLMLLRACFYSKGSMQEVAEDLGYSNAHSASVQKYKCIAKLKVSIELNKIQEDDFVE